MTTKIIPTIFAIDTSCDDTSAAIVKGTIVLSNIIASQTQLHKPYGGVFPTVAKKAHKENIDRTILLALKKAQINWEDINAIAVTQGPGLAPALEVGIKKAKELSLKHNKPLITVNHIEGHSLSILAQAQPKNKVIENNFSVFNNISDTKNTDSFPILSIIVSGGHTEFIEIKKIGEYAILGSTVDDSAGEALDKVGRMLNLGYPAGPVIEEFAKLGDPNRFTFPLPMTSHKNYNLSFSGLKTFARNLIEQLTDDNELDKQAVMDFAASFQKAVFRHICHKMNKIFLEYDFKQIWLGGGVSANTTLRKMVRQTIRNHPKQKTRKLIAPYSKKLCMDNAAMIGIVGSFKYSQNKIITNKTKIEEIERIPRYKIGT